MQAEGTVPSKPVSSSQDGPHPKLADLVRRHLARPASGPIPTHTREAFEAVRSILAVEPTRPLVLDGGCGTGGSTVALAQTHPAAWILGVEQSAVRLQRGRRARGEQDSHGLVHRVGERVLLVRAEQAAMYRCLVEASIRLGVHYLLYPNPWPKPGHLQRRWHGHPSFRELLRLGGRLVVRSNWPIYLEEMATAVLVATGANASVQPYQPKPALTPFEKKYAESGHTLAQLQVTLRPLQKEAWSK